MDMLRNMMASGGPPPRMSAPGGGGGRGMGRQPAPRTEGLPDNMDMAGLLGALGPDGMPDFDKIAKAAGMDPKEMRGHAQRLWKHMDQLAADSPGEYQAFLEKQAKAAGVDPSTFGGASDGAGAGGKAASGSRASQPAGRSSVPSSERATFLMPMAQQGGDAGVGVVAVWRAGAKQSAGPLADLAPVPDTPAAGLVKLRTRKPPRVEKVALPDPRVPEDDTAGDISTLMAGTNKNVPGMAPEMEATVYDVEAHPEAVERALDDAAFQALLLESAALFVEREMAKGVKLARGARRCYTHRADATPKTAAAAAAAAARQGGLGAGMSSQLLTEIAGLSSGARSKPSPFIQEVSSRKPGALIQEVKPSHTVRVERCEGGMPMAVEVEVFLPALAAVTDANLEVSDRYVHLTPAAGDPDMVIALPVKIDPDVVSAKFKKKEKKLTLKLRPAA